MQDKLKFFTGLIQQQQSVIPYPVGEQTGFLGYHPDAVQQILTNKEGLYQEWGHPFRELMEDYTDAGKHALSLAKFPKNYKENVLAISKKYALDLIAILRSNDGPINFYKHSKIKVLQIITKMFFDYELTIEKATDFVKATETLETFVMEGRARDAAYTAQHQILIAICDHILKQLRPENTFDSPTINAVMRTLLNAYNGPSTCLAWAVYELSNKPMMRERLQAEAQKALPMLEGATLKGLAQSRYATAIIMETLRLYPPAWLISRRAKKAHKLLGVEIPKGAEITVCSYNSHRHPHFWKNANTFQPQRFSDEKLAHPYAYFPFGGGKPICPARSYAIQLIQILLLHLAAHFDWKQEAESKPFGLISLRPTPNMQLVFRGNHFLERKES